MPYRRFDDSDSDSEDENIVYVSEAARAPAAPPPKADNVTRKIKCDGEPPFPCEMCPERNRPLFDTWSERIDHKLRVGHHYCKKCDVDFGNRDALELHFFNSNKHITCWLCAKEFKSESGLGLHMAQNHKSSTGAMCPRCHESFSTQSGWLQHVEGNLCAGGLKRSDVYGAVVNEQTRLNRVLASQMEAAAAAAAAANASSGGSSNSRDQDDTGVVKPFEQFKIYDADKAGRSPGSDERMEVKDEWYDVQRGHWVCPYKNCRKKFHNMNSLDQHINSATHIARNFNCEGCKKRFASSSAMMQHIESNMCRISKMQSYGIVKQSLTASIHPDKSRHSEYASTYGDSESSGSTKANLSVMGKKTAGQSWATDPQNDEGPASPGGNKQSTEW
ncbi:hypothetical protein H072_1286 [Dactylellina haptotyla CBS 200.50]|uniref:C2H2-type domain-containing protein n=1 Tax=Dactylellina haptotyla (strain CBS 200.50) TaxID=1284197 RepID=S8APF5_DACHA|nr:hypothetical protein H072_1286 [Dactylellina haptotyla CBS 200.50]